MNDRELLELAAKAIGIDGARYEDGSWLETRYGYTCAIYHEDLGSYWNPLESNSDAFGLFVTLGSAKVANLEIGPGGAVFAVHHPYVDASEFNDPKEVEFDPAKAARRAIAFAAAEIGRKLAAPSVAGKEG